MFICCSPMFLKITSPDANIFSWEVEKVTIPTEWWAITILPGHTPLVSCVKPGILSIWSDIVSNSSDNAGAFDYIFENKSIKISIAKWILFVDGSTITVLTSSATTNPIYSSKELEQMKSTLEKDIEHMRQNGHHIEDIEKSIMSLKKMEADLELVKITNR